MIPAAEALQRLKQGNDRFVAGEIDPASHSHSDRREALSDGQQPFAIVLGCSDSRVPVEVVFDQGLGELFVIRVAGNIAARSQIGSVEYAAQVLGARLVVVLGHSSCGAVSAAIEELRKPSVEQSENLQFIVGRIRPAVESVVAEGYEHDPDSLVSAIVRENVRATARSLQEGSPIIDGLVSDGGLVIVGAEYSLRTGKVEFL